MVIQGASLPHFCKGRNRHEIKRREREREREAFQGAPRLLYEDREKVTVTAHGVILHPAVRRGRRARVALPPPTYRVAHIHRSTWRDVRAGHQLSRHVPGTCEHVAVLTSGLFIPTSLVCADVRGSPSPLGLLPIFVGRPLIGNNRLDGFAGRLYSLLEREGGKKGGRNVWLKTYDLNHRFADAVSSTPVANLIFKLNVFFPPSILGSFCVVKFTPAPWEEF